MEQTFARPDYAKHAAGVADGIAVLDDAAMEFGQLYRSTAILGAGAELPEAARPDRWAGQPGTRAPHLWVEKAGKRVSTLDLFDRGWALIAEDERWAAAAARASEAVGVPVESLRIGVDLRTTDEPALRKAFGIGATGASLIRPDGFVAWRAVELAEDPSQTLTDALATVSSARPR